MRKLFLALLATTTTALTSCDKKDDVNNQETLNDQDGEFMVNATYINVGEIKSGNQVQQRSITPLIKSYAGLMVSDHTAAQGQLSTIAHQWGYLLPTETDLEHKQLDSTLTTLDSMALDSTYIYMMVGGHDKAIEIYQYEINNGESSTLKAIAGQKLPELQHHRALADSIAHSLFP